MLGVREYLRKWKQAGWVTMTILTLATGCDALPTVDPVGSDDDKKSHHDDDHRRPTPTPTPSGTPRPSPTVSCTGTPQTRTWTVSPTRIQGHRILYFESRELLALLTDPSLKIDAATLVLTIAGKNHQETDQAISLDVNGIRTFGTVGPHFIKFNGKHEDEHQGDREGRQEGEHQGNQQGEHEDDHGDDHEGESSTTCELNLAWMKLNGAELVPAALRRIAMQKGQLILSLRGEDLKVSKAVLTLHGQIGMVCTSPTPAGTPTPVPSPTPFPAPTTSIVSVSPTGATVASSTMSIQFTGNQTGLSFRCSLDGSTPALCTSPVIYSNLSNGAHTFNVAAVNVSGVADPIGAAYSWTVDLVPPSVTITNAAALPTLTNSPDVSFDFVATKPSSTFQCSIDGGAYGSCASPKAYSALAEGVHTFAVRATDSLGNQGQPAQFQWSVDLTPPVAKFVDVVPPESNTPSTSTTLSFTSSESATFECRLDQNPFATCSSPVTLSGLADGLHSFEIRATDLAGNPSGVAAYSWNVDTVAPVVTLSNPVPAAGLTSASSVSVEFTASETATYRCSLDGAAAVSCSSPFSASSLGEGAHHVEVVAVDLAGNVSAPASIAWTMDHTLPTLAWGAMLPSAASVINSSNFQAAVTSSEPVTLSCSLNNNPLNQSSSPVSLQGLSEGVYQLAVTGTDAAGNPGNSLLHVFTVDLTPPSVQLSADVTGISSKNSNTFQFTANETATFECSLDHAGFALCTSPTSVSGLVEGSHLFEVRATDVAGNVSSVSALQWSVDTTPPVVTTLSVIVGRTNVTLNWTTSEPATSQVNWGPGVTTPNTTTEDPQLVTSHSVVIGSLTPNTIYTVIAVGKDAAGNPYSSAKKQFRTSP